MKNSKCRSFYENVYQEQGIVAQRQYPNEELCRFLGRYFFHRVPKDERGEIRVLEAGCGTCSNLRMIAREGFDAYGIDLSETSLEYGKEMLTMWDVSATLKPADMCSIPFKDCMFDVVLDVFSSYCLTEEDFNAYLDEIVRVLSPGGLYFSYTPSSHSEAFTNHDPAEKIDDWTLNGIYRTDSPYVGQEYPFRFTSPEHYSDLLKHRGLEVLEVERVGRTYNNMSEYFEFVVIVGRK